MKKILVLFFLLFVIISGSAVLLLTKAKESATPVNVSEECRGLGGVWLEEFRECENIFPAWCTQFQGLFRECESACRHNPEAEVCTQQCVPVCILENTEELTKDPRNMQYRIQGKSVVVKNGKSVDEATRIFDAHTKADVNFDGLEDTLVLLTQDGGGSGTFFYVTVALQKESGYEASEAMFLGDRISPQTIDVVGNRITVNYVERYPWESMDTKPSVGKTKYLSFEENRLVETEQETPIPETELLTLVEKTLGNAKKNDCDKITVAVLDGRDNVFYTEVIFEGLKDDSVKSKKEIYALHKENGLWIMGENILHEEYICQEGRGQNTFSSEVCK